MPDERGDRGFQSSTGFAAAAPATPLPAALLHDLVPQMSDPAELVVTLYAVAALQRVRRFPRLLPLAELRAERPLIEALASLAPERSAEQALEDGLQAALARGSLLRSSDANDQARDWIALNSADGRRAVAHSARLIGRPARAAPAPLGPEAEGQAIIRLYEEAIGPLPPSLAAELHEAAATYPPEWIADAFAEAVEMNVHNWRYVRSILQRWQQEGRDDASPRSIRAQMERSGPSRYDHLIQR